MKALIILLTLMLARTAHADCWQNAGTMFKIDPSLLMAIAQQESALNHKAVGHNRDGSRDLGLMQINSTPLPRLTRLGVSEQRLLNDPCLSVIVGASILADMMNRYGYSWEAVGAYNAGTAPERQALRMRYAKQILIRYHKLRSP